MQHSPELALTSALHSLRMSVLQPQYACALEVVSHDFPGVVAARPSSHSHRHPSPLCAPTPCLGSPVLSGVESRTVKGCTSTCFKLTSWHVLVFQVLAGGTRFPGQSLFTEEPVARAPCWHWFPQSMAVRQMGLDTGMHMWGTCPRRAR